MKEPCALPHGPECGPGRRASFVGELRRPVTFNLMLEVDDSQFTPDDYAFLKEWAEALRVSVAVLIGRIVLAIIEGDQYVEDRPTD